VLSGRGWPILPMDQLAAINAPRDSYSWVDQLMALRARLPQRTSHRSRSGVTVSAMQSACCTDADPSCMDGEKPPMWSGTLPNKGVIPHRPSPTIDGIKSQKG